MRTTLITNDTYYHVFNRGNMKQTLFHEPADYARFLFILLYFQSPETVENIHRHIKYFLKSGDFKVDPDVIKKISTNDYVDILNFCIMPNHFHITIYNKSKTGLSQYMHRVGNAYAKYFNTKFEQTGHVFQGAYKAVPLYTDEQLTYVSAYIHRNPIELLEWKKQEEKYPWSSLQDYRQNRWGALLQTDIVMDKFNDYSDYKAYLDCSGAKVNDKL